MARKKQVEQAPEGSNKGAPTVDQPTSPAAENLTSATVEQQRPLGSEPNNERVYAADPRSVISVSLSDHTGGPTLHLLRSQKYNQMQIRFDGEYPDEKHLAMLRNAGWKDRTESEGIWTQQIDKNARWQSVDRMERDFKAVANAIRQDKGLTPALEGLSAA
jgi:hypothetical protein